MRGKEVHSFISHIYDCYVYVNLSWKNKYMGKWKNERMFAYFKWALRATPQSYLRDLIYFHLLDHYSLLLVSNLPSFPSNFTLSCRQLMIFLPLSLRTRSAQKRRLPQTSLHPCHLASVPTRLAGPAHPHSRLRSFSWGGNLHVSP